MNIDDEIMKLIDNLGDNFNIMSYVHNNSDKFVPGISTVLYSGPYWDRKEPAAAIKALLTSKWITSGENVQTFENRFARMFNDRYGLMVNSGSSANLAMLAAMKLVNNWNDSAEIIVSPAGFPTTVSTIYQNDMTPVFCDIEFQTLNFDLDLLEQKINKNTVAIFLSPVLGNPPDIDRLLNICDQYGLKLILDGCDSLGSKWDGKYLNEFSECTSDSLYVAHIASTGQGGMVTSKNKEIVDVARRYATWGRSCFIGGTKIDTENGLKNIENVVPGDKVFTHTGNYMEVEEVFNKPYSGELMTIKCEKKELITCTPDHKFFVIRMDDKLSAATRYVPMKDPVWLEASKLGQFDYLVEKVSKENVENQYMTWNYDTFFENKTESLLIDNDLMRLCGYWVAEGSLVKGDKGSNGVKNKNYKRTVIYYRYRVEFAFNVNETETIEDVENLMKKYFGIEYCYKYVRGNENGIKLSFNSRKAYEFFNQFFGTISYNKSLPDFFVTMEKEKISEFLKGFWIGDGTSWNGRSGEDGKKTRRSTFAFCTNSHK
ncbi:MAG: DegT/DnrJ/EryC1/StrS family aminotransferase [Oligoflexia bacterium]|nr:DegT/DnrJ/EryC1/StrS family aminotransferase [Oligoflexia bacterium]